MNDSDFTSNLCSINEIDPEKVALVQKQALPENTVERLSRLFSALSDPTRLKILHALTVTEELCVCDLATILEMTPAAVSQHLSRLRSGRLVQSRRDGMTIYYRLVDSIDRALLAPVLEVE